MIIRPCRSRMKGLFSAHTAGIEHSIPSSHASVILVLSSRIVGKRKRCLSTSGSCVRCCYRCCCWTECKCQQVKFILDAEIDLLLFNSVQPSHQTCQYGNTEIELSLYNGTHSAENLSTGCSLTRCSNTSGFCRPSPTPCFVYRTAYNRSYCAPASLCSGLVPCANSGNQCPSSRSVCVVNSCCSPAAVCLPLLWTELCPSTGNTINTS